MEELRGRGVQSLHVPPAPASLPRPRARRPASSKPYARGVFVEAPSHARGQPLALIPAPAQVRGGRGWGCGALNMPHFQPLASPGEGNPRD